MPEHRQYEVFARGLFDQIPPGEEGFIAFAEIMADYYRRVADLRQLPHHSNIRRGFMDAAGDALLKALFVLCDTELPNLPPPLPELPISAPAPTPAD